ncbi:hypothetical protein Q5752_002269 [Cryptotrichosporon argae]
MKPLLDPFHAYLPFPSLQTLRAALPTPRPARLLDVVAGFALPTITALLLVPGPCTSTYLLRRAAAPLVIGAWAYLAWVPLQLSTEDRWGVSVLAISLMMRTLELLVFFPPEGHVYRVQPAPPPAPPPAPASQAVPDQLAHAGATTVAEPVPPPYTLAKFWWALSLWWSFRGIGWNYSPSLPTSSLREPYLPTSSRRAYLLTRAWHLARAWAILDLVRLYQLRLDPAFFIGTPGAPPAYAALGVLHRAAYSVAVAARVWFSLEQPHVACSILLVGLGALTGWTGEWCEPRGWPPMFGGLRDLWRHPGLGYMWSRTWNQYNRRVLHVLCWVGIGERVLGLPHSGEPTRPRPPVASAAVGLRLAPAPPGSETDKLGPITAAPSASTLLSPAASTSPSPSSSASPSPSPSPSGRSSPSNPLPIAPASRAPPKPLALYASNLAKSVIVFLVSGLMHDWGTLVLTLDAVGRGEPRAWADALVLTPFFAVQPAGLVVEAIVKRLWRSFKRDHSGHGPRKASEDGTGAAAEKVPVTPALVLVERAVGFVWTWVWLGYTARHFVEGMCRIGVWEHDGPLFSPAARVIYGKWLV